MSEFAPEPYTPAEMRLGDEEAFLVGIQNRKQQKINPSSGSAGPFRFEGTNQIEFQWTHSDGVDLGSTVLYFKWTPTTAVNGDTLDNSGCLSQASDIIDRVEFTIDNTEVLNSTNRSLSVVQNILMFSEYNNDYFNREGKILLGHSSQSINPTHDLKDGVGLNGTSNADARRNSKSRVYGVPLWAIHVGFAAQKMIPVLGSNMRLVLHLNNPAKVLNTRNSINSSYKLENVYLIEDRLMLTPNYKEALMNRVKSQEGYRIHYVDFEVQAQNINDADTQSLVVRNEHSNALTLILFNEYDALYRADVSSNGTDTRIQPSYPSFDVDIAKRTENLRVECGTLSFTGLNGSSSLVEHFVHLERANGSLGMPNSTGCYNWDLYAGGADSLGYLPDRWNKADNLNPVVNFSPIMVSLEKTLTADSDANIVNRGLSGLDPGSSRDIEVYLKYNTDEKLNKIRERLFSVLVYEKTLVMANGTLQVQH